MAIVFPRPPPNNFDNIFMPNPNPPSKAEQEQQIQDLVNVVNRVGGGGGSGLTQREIDVAREGELARQAQAEEARRAQEKERARIEEEARKAEAEKRRIEQLRLRVLQEGAQERVEMLKNSEGDRIRQTTTEIRKIENGKSTNALVWKYENLDTGEIRYRSYEGAGRRLTGGVDTSQQSCSETNKIKNDLINSGLKPIVINGQVIGFTSPDTQKSYGYDERGFNAYDRDSQQGVAKFRQATREYISNKNNNGMSMAPPEEKNKIRRLATRLQGNIEVISEEIRQSSRNRDIQNLAVLQRKGNNLTSFERAEKSRLSKKVKENYKNVGKVLGYAFANSILNLGIGGYDLANQAIKNPIGTLTSLPGNIKRAVINDSVRFIRDPLGALTVITEYVALGGALKEIGETAKATLRGLDIAGGKITGRYVKNAKDKFIIKKAGLTLKKQTVSSGAKSLKYQAGLAGKRVTAVTAQANQLTSWIRRKKIIRKPVVQPNSKFPKGEASFPLGVQRLLRKFDAGQRLSNKEFAKVNMWLRRNVAPNITLLERSLYLDPAKGLRVSRLGIQAERTAGVRDILRWTFKLFGSGNKPQVLIFENAQVARFPRALRNIERKLKAGKTLSVAETNKLIRWQVKTGSGKFKPIGSTIYSGGRELEVTLAPGEMIRRLKRVGFTYIKGKKVTFVTAEIYKPGSAILRQIKKANLGKLSSSALERLERLLSRKLGRRIRIETPARIGKNLKRDIRDARRMNPNIPVLRVRGLGLFVLSRVRFGRATLERRLLGGRVTKRPLSLRRVGRRIRIETPARIGKNLKRDIRDARRMNPNIPVLRVRGPGLFVLSRGRFGRATLERRLLGGRVTKRPLSLRRVGRRGRVPGRPRPGRPGRPGKGSPTPRIKLNQFKSQRLSSAIPTFYVVEKIRGKFRKLYPKPLTLKDARDYAVYSIDNHLSKTAFFVPMGRARRVVRPPRQISNYASRNSFKVRPYRIRFGKKRRLVNGYIEKRRFFQDTLGEKRALRVARRISPQRRRQLIKQLQKARAVRFGNRPRTSRIFRPQRVQRIARRRTRTISPQQRRILLLRLKKARMVRMRNLRRR